MENNLPTDAKGAAGGVWDPARRRRQLDETDYAHRHFVNLTAAVFLLAMTIAIVWTVQQMQAYETLRACIDSGRRDCVKIDQAPRTGVFLPPR